MLYIEIRVFPFPHKPFDRFVMKLRHTAAFLADYLHAHRVTGKQFIFCSSTAAALPFICMQNSCQNEQIERIIYGSDGNSFCFAGFNQLVGGKRLGKRTHLFQYHIPYCRRTHIVRAYVRTQQSQCTRIYLRPFHFPFSSFIFQLSTLLDTLSSSCVGYGPRG